MNLVKIQTGSGAPTKSALKALDATGSKRDQSGEASKSEKQRASASFETIGVPGDNRKKKEVEVVIEGEDWTVEEIEIKIAEYDRTIRRQKNFRDKLKKNTRMLGRQKNEKLDEAKAIINDLSNRI